jgi:Right handed beta helix region
MASWRLRRRGSSGGGRRLHRTMAVVGGGLLLATSAAVSSAAATSNSICVGHRSGCYTTIQAAVDAARDGDTIRIGAGTFAGGVTITKSVRVVGAGPGRTVVRGGGPVVTIGELLAPNEHTVAIWGVTVTGGRTSGDGVEARGGGILVQPAAGDTTGATVTLRDVVVTHNRAEPTETVTSPSGAPCPTGPCPFASAAGGGIFSAGTLSLDGVVVSHNLAGGVASDALGGGVFSEFGTLTLDRTLVVGNAAVATRPNGRFAEGGGLFVSSGAVTVGDSAVSGNRAELTSSLPIFAADGETVIDMNAHGGGVHVSGGGVPARFDHTVISGNSVRVTDPVGEPLGFDAAMLVDADSSLTMRDSVISHNTVTVTVATTADVGPSGTALELGGSARISNTRITDNHVTVTSPDGVAGATGGVAVYNFSDEPPEQVVIADSVISDNTARAFSTTGSATVQGVGVLNNSLLELRDVVVRGNSGHARGPEATAQGGGIWNGVLLSGPPVELTLRRTRVVENSLSTSAGGTVQGAGLSTTEPVTLQDSVIARNRPDQCFGCTVGGP